MRPLTNFLGKIFPWRKKSTSQISQIHSKKRTLYSPAKQAELEKLCNLLFQKKELITSGKFQFVGLNKIKELMGKRWAGLCQIVYDTTEEVIEQYMDKGDIFIRYKDDTYVIIFAHAGLEEARIKVALIAEKIRQRLFELNEKELRDMEIRNAVGQLRRNVTLDLGFPDDEAYEASNIDLVDHPQEINPADIEGTEVGTERYREKGPALPLADLAELDLTYSYIPLWDTQRNALTTYLCLGRNGTQTTGSSPFAAHIELYDGRTAQDHLQLDLKMLETVTAELAAMKKDGRKLFVVCPAQYQTLHDFKSYEVYKQRLSLIPESQRPFLILLVMNTNKNLPTKDVYWFATPLHDFCRHVFAEIPLRRDINFNYLRNSGVDVAGVRLDERAGLSEHDLMALLNNFGARAKALKIPHSFILDVPSLSLTTTAVCAGFDFLGGQAIHDPVEKPDSVHRYRNEDLLSGLAQKK